LSVRAVGSRWFSGEYEPGGELVEHCDDELEDVRSLIDPLERLRAVKRLQQVLRLLEGEAINGHQTCAEASGDEESEKLSILLSLGQADRGRGFESLTDQLEQGDSVLRKVEVAQGVHDALDADHLTEVLATANMARVSAH
jgi:hypothetical protein